MIATTLLALLPLVAAPADLDVNWKADPAYAAGMAYTVEVAITAGPEGAEIPVWLLGPGAFEKDGKPLGPRPKGEIALSGGAKLSVTFDLSDELGETEKFSLGFAKEFTDEKPIDVRVFALFSDEKTDFMTAPLEELASYAVLMETDQGSMIFELWPDVAPNHVRNFLDLNHRGFYENTVFHRVSPYFMIQGGDPMQRAPGKTRWSGGGGIVRSVNAEFNDRKHVYGVLSAARSQSINSASSQFFVMMATNPGLDGQYSGYGRLVSGDIALDRIANAKGTQGRDSTIRPAQPPKVLRTSVLTSL